MTAELQKTEKYELTEKDLATLQDASIIPKGTPMSQVQLFAKVCTERQLSPFSKQIYIIGRNTKNGTMYTHQTSIDGYRAIAERTGVYGGSDDYLYDGGKKLQEMLNDNKKQPTTATVTVYKVVQGIRCAFSATASWSEYFNSYNPIWNKMPFNQLGKCAESAALRKAFPGSLGGIHTSEEPMHDEVVEAEEVKAKEEPAKKKEPVKKKPEVEEATVVEEKKEAKPAAKKETPKAEPKKEEAKDNDSQTDIYTKYVLKIDEYVDADTLKSEAQAIITDAMTDGLSQDNNKELQGYINTAYMKLKG